MQRAELGGSKLLAALGCARRTEVEMRCMRERKQQEHGSALTAPPRLVAVPAPASVAWAAPAAPASALAPAPAPRSPAGQALLSVTCASGPSSWLHDHTEKAEHRESQHPCDQAGATNDGCTRTAGRAGESSTNFRRVDVHACTDTQRADVSAMNTARQHQHQHVSRTKRAEVGGHRRIHFSRSFGDVRHGAGACSAEVVGEVALSSARHGLCSASQNRSRVSRCEQDRRAPLPPWRRVS